MRFGYFGDEPGVLRLSSVLRRCREQNAPPEVAAELRRIHAMFPACPTHGPLEDPVIGYVGQPPQIGIICPWCSDPKILAAWEAEGKQANA